VWTAQVAGKQFLFPCRLSPSTQVAVALGPDEDATEFGNENWQEVKEDKISVNVELVNLKCLSHGPK